MLSALRLRNFAIAADVHFELGAGLVVVTGETGAGKSILVDALGLLLGGRGGDKVVRAGAEIAEIEALFEGVRDAEVLAAAGERGIELEDGTLIVRRVIGRNGVRRAFLNGVMATTADLRAVAGPLVDLSTQHQQHRLLERRNHLAILDRAAGLQTDVAAYAAAFAEWQALQRRHDALAAQLEQAAERRDYLRFCQDELAEAAIEVGELARLEAEVRRLRASEGLRVSAGRAVAAIGDEGGARDALAGLPRELERSRRDDATLADFGARFEEVVALLDELSADLERYADGVRRNPARLDAAEARLDQVLKLVRKYGGSEEALLARAEAIDVELQQEQRGADELAALKARLPARSEQLRAEAWALSQRRRAAAPGLGQAVEAVIAELGMASARFVVEVEGERDGALGADGLDRVAFMLQSNPGEPAQGLVEVASGGELSRVLLGLERAAARVGCAETAVYDEVDAGLSGSTGIALGRFLWELGRGQQVVVISHLPQVAAAADLHLHVRKVEVDGRTESAVEALDDSSRYRELARMLGAADAASATAIEHARALRRQFPTTSGAQTC